MTVTIKPGRRPQTEMSQDGISPSEQIVRAAAAPVQVQDDFGRTLTLKKPPFLAQFKLTEAMGKSADIESYRKMVIPLIMLTAIDGEPVPTPSVKAEIDALLKRLGDEGYMALLTGIAEHFGEQDDPEEAKAKVKN